MNSFKEKLIRQIFRAASYASLFFLFGIMFVLFKESLTALGEINIFNFLLGKDWYPTYEPPDYGILPLISGSLAVSFVAMFICVPLGLGTALYMHEIACDRQRKFLKPAIEILSAVPSIIFGFFGLVILAPFLQKNFNLPTGQCLLTASIMLGVMTIPIITSLSEDALSFVPRSFKEASYALGANRWQTLLRVTIPAAASGIITSIIMGMGRLMGETMIVLMVAGGAAVIPNSLFAPVRPMTSSIAAEMGEAAQGSLHFSALFEIGLLLFIITFVLNIIAEIISRRYRLKLGQGR
ncbi:MAG: phosphate ABC transporter permease subunit PstC [Elusimicrobiota bacterium]|jgi:phosphate transport system permease protein|nr:phosphate ABC transporter permease subunit PstC [Elusimicrobiota bacterium]